MVVPRPVTDGLASAASHDRQCLYYEGDYVHEVEEVPRNVRFSRASIHLRLLTLCRFQSRILLPLEGEGRHGEGDMGRHR